MPREQAPGAHHDIGTTGVDESERQREVDEARQRADEKKAQTEEQKRRAKASAASKQATTSAQGSARRDAPPLRFAPATKVSLRNRPLFRFAAIQAGQVTELTHVESVTWDDSTEILNGQLVIRQPDAVKKFDPFTLIREGDQVLCQYNEGHGWKEMWLMRCYKPSLSLGNNQWGFELRNDLDLLRRSQAHLLYSKRNHPAKRGWRGDEIIRDVCAKFQIKLGAVYKGEVRFNKVEMGGGNPGTWQASPLQLIHNVVLREQRLGRFLTVRFEGGRLYVLPLVRSSYLLELGPTIIDGVLNAELPEEFGSAVTLRALVGVKKLKEKGAVKLQSKAAVARYGYVLKNLWSSDATTEAELREEARLYLAAIGRAIKTMSIDHAGIPQLRRGHAIKLALGTGDLNGQVVFVTRITSTVTPDDYRMNVTVVFHDPFSPTRYAQILTKVVPDQSTANAINEEALRKAQAAYMASDPRADVAVTESPYAQRLKSLVGNAATLLDPSGGVFK